MSTEYKLYRTEHGDIVECYSCGCEVPLCEPGHFAGHDKEARQFCEICSNSYIANVTQYSNQYSSETRQLAIIIAQVGNHIKELINAKHTI